MRNSGQRVRMNKNQEQNLEVAEGITAEYTEIERKNHIRRRNSPFAKTLFYY